MNPNMLADEAARIADRAQALALQLHDLSAATGPVAEAINPFLFLLTIFLLACFVAGMLVVTALLFPEWSDVTGVAIDRYELHHAQWQRCSQAKWREIFRHRRLPDIFLHYFL